MLFRSQPKSFGIDIGEKTLRLVALEKSVGRIKLAGFNAIKIPKGLIREGQLTDTKQLSVIIQTLIQKSSRIPKTKNVVASLPETQTFTKVARLQPKETEYTEEEILQEIEQHIPFQIHETIIDWQWIIPEKSNPIIAFAAIPKTTIKPYIEALEACELKILAFETEAQALTRCLIQEKRKPGPLCILEIGSERSTFIIQEDGVIFFTRHIDTFCGDRITEAIENSLRISFAEAEKLKMIYRSQKTNAEAKIQKALSPLFEELCGNTKQTIEYYANHLSPTQEPVSEILLAGGAAYTKDIIPFLEASTKLPVSWGNPWQKIKKPSIHDFPLQSSLSFVTAIGLALKGWIKE